MMVEEVPFVKCSLIDFSSCTFERVEEVVKLEVLDRSVSLMVTKLVGKSPIFPCNSLVYIYISFSHVCIHPIILTF